MSMNKDERIIELERELERLISIIESTDLNKAKRVLMSASQQRDAKQRLSEVIDD